MPSQPTIALKVEAADRAYQQAAVYIARAETLFRDGAEITNLYAEQEDPIIRASLLADAVQKFAASAALQSQIVNQLKIAVRAMAAANSARAAGAESIAISVERAKQRVAKLESEAQRLKAVTAAANKSQRRAVSTWPRPPASSQRHNRDLTRKKRTQSLCCRQRRNALT